MLRVHLAGTTAALFACTLAAQAQQAAPPPFATTKVTDNVYIFRYGGHQSMFIVTPAGVIATDPISERRPAKPYVDAIQAVTKAPITRSEERRVGKECVSLCRSRWSPYH